MKQNRRHSGNTGRNKPVKSPEERGGITAVQFAVSLLQHNKPQKALHWRVKFYLKQHTMYCIFKLLQIMLYVVLFKHQASMSFNYYFCFPTGCWEWLTDTVIFLMKDFPSAIPQKSGYIKNNIYFKTDLKETQTYVLQKRTPTPAFLLLDRGPVLLNSVRICTYIYQKRTLFA